MIYEHLKEQALKAGHSVECGFRPKDIKYLKDISAEDPSNKTMEKSNCPKT